MKNLKILVLWLGIAGYLTFALGFVSDKVNNQVCERIIINITDSLTNRFISEVDVVDILVESEDSILGYPLSDINIGKLENLLAGEPFIKSAELYRTANGRLCGEILQRNPVLRIINQQGQSYYLDASGYILPVSEKFTSRVLVANGYISEPFVAESSKSIFDVEIPPDKRDQVIYDLLSLASFIKSSDLWNAQITQIYVNNKYEYELIPRVGAHIIELGGAVDYEKKFRKLEALYSYGFNNKGWNNYEKIDLKYENQVVCTKR